MAVGGWEKKRFLLRSRSFIEIRRVLKVWLAGKALGLDAVASISYWVEILER